MLLDELAAQPQRPLLHCSRPKRHGSTFGLLYILWSGVEMHQCSARMETMCPGGGSRRGGSSAGRGEVPLSQAALTLDSASNTIRAYRLRSSIQLGLARATRTRVYQN